MAASWIRRNSEGIVRAFSHPDWTDRSTLLELAEGGRLVELVDTGDAPLLLNKPLPEGTKVIHTFNSLK